MDPLDEVSIDKGHGRLDAPEPERPRSGGVPVAGVIAVVVVVAALAFWYLWIRQPAPAQGAATVPAAQAPAQAGTAARTPLGPVVEPEELPPLFLTDPLVRDLLERLSSRPEIAAWLTTAGLIRNFVVCLDNVASGQTPARQLRRLAPSAPFKAEARGSALVIDSRSYVRYNGLADATTSLDPAGLARIYARLKPRLAEAYRELGHPDGDIDNAVERAIVMLLQAPVPDGDIRLRQKVLSYRFETEALEDLEPVQKQLIRMGPRNQRAIQTSLRAIARALGIPENRLPAAPPTQGR